MKNYQMVIRYDGTRYKGWQRLGGKENTIQDKLESVLTKFMKTKMEIIGGGRTDAGVHAIEQVANFKTKEPINVYDLMDYFAKYLPDDIAVTAVNEAEPDFHARFGVKKKTYLYKIWNKKYSEPFLRKYSMHVTKKLDIEKMKVAAAYFTGEHDFTSFTTARSKSKSMVRTLYSIEIENQEGLILIRITGNGFLHNMARKIVGTLIMAGSNDIKPKEIPNILLSGERARAALLADACGLYLEKSEY